MSELEPPSAPNSSAPNSSAPNSSAPNSETPEPGASALRSFFGLFLVPLLVVISCVAVFVGFGWIAYDRQTTADYLHDLQSSWRPRRAQAAYELAKVLSADPTALAADPEARREVRRLYSEAEDQEIKRYLTLVLGHTADPEAVPLLLEAVDSADPQMQIYALWALGAIGDPRGMSPLLEALQSGDPGIRKTAAFALGELDDPSAKSALEPLLEDAVADVRWNAALASARLQNPRAVPVLERMLDRTLTAQVPDITPEQQEEVMVGALKGLAALNSAASLPLITRLADSDPNLKVRQAAIEARKALGAG